jgi:acetyl esterase/lipase
MAELIDIDYSSENSKHKMDVFISDSAPADGLHPGVLFIHGGGWNNGTKDVLTDDFPILKAAILAHGISIVTVGFRYSVEASQYMVSFWDVIRALDFIRSHSTAWGIDFYNMGYCGNSSGGTQALWAAYDGSDGFPLPKCVAAWNATTTMDVYTWMEMFPDPADQAGILLEMGQGALLQFWGLSDINDYDENDLALRAQMAAASPETYLQAGLPPTFLAHDNQPASLFTVHSAQFGLRLQTLAGQIAGGPTVTVTHAGLQTESEQQNAMADFFRDNLIGV